MRERAEALDGQFQIESVLEKRYPAQGGNTGLMSALMEVEQDIQVVGTAGDGRQAVRQIKKSQGTNNCGSRFDRAIAVFDKHGGILRTSQALRAGIHPSTLYAMRDAGSLEVVSRGVYRLAGSEPLGNPDLVTVTTRVLGGVICLISALAFHEITTQIPHQVHVALVRGAEEPRLDHPPIKTYRFTGQAFTEGVEIYELDGISVRIYSPEKTLADCFKFRNKVGLDTAVEAVRFYRERRSIKVDDLMRYAAICRVEKIIRPYLEAIL